MRRRWIWIFLVFGWPAVVSGQFDYRAEFVAGKVGEEWSRKEVGTVPAGGRKFLGPFAGHEVVRLRLGEFDSEVVRYFRVSFTLFVIHGADGNYHYYGPDPWVLRVAGGPELWRTTFSNCGWISVNNDQGYPDPFPGTHHAAWTGAAEKGALGWIKTWGGKPQPVDSVYEMHAVFPHRGGELVLEFVSESEETISGEAWGLEKLRVEEIAAEVRDAKGWEELWETLGDENASMATQALWGFVAGGRAGAAFLEGEMGGGENADGDEVVGLLDSLDSESFVEREKASRRLLELGNSVRAALEQKMGEAGLSPEERARLAGLLGRLDAAEKGPPDGERLREMRARWALGILDSS